MKKENKKKAQDRLKAYEQRHALDHETFHERQRREWRELLSRAPDDEVFSKLHDLDARWLRMFEDDHFDVAFDEGRLLAQALMNESHPKHFEAKWLLHFFIAHLRSDLTDLLKNHPGLGKPETK